MYRTRHPGRGPKVEQLLGVDAGRRPVERASFALALGLAAAGLWAQHVALVSAGWALAAFFAPALLVAAKALTPPLISHWLEIGPGGVRLWARLGRLTSVLLGGLPLEEGLSVRATPLGGRSPLEVEVSVEGPSGRLTWRTVGLEASALVQDRVIAALDARLAEGRPGSFHGGRLQVRLEGGRLEIRWPGDGPSAARTKKRLLTSAAALALAAAGPSLAPEADPGAFAALAGAAVGAGLMALLRAPAALTLARSTLVLTPRSWRYESRGLLWHATRAGAGPLRASPGRGGPGPRRDVEGDAERRVALQAPGRGAFEVGGSLTLRERRWLIELVERFHDVARAH
ncbi:MAG TPA: hypothetical protein VFS43_48105 [Polyangiaceae bacterium]|nr:hypothetical protein [Polyangiaceae bacterium]